MKTFHWLLLTGVTALTIAACNRAAAPAPVDAGSRPQLVASIKDIMDSMVDPSADYLWESVATIVSAAGTEERRPKTDEDWSNVRRAALRVIEGANLLVMDGRHVAKPGEKSENPGIELEPEQMEKLINDDRPAFI